MEPTDARKNLGELAFEKLKDEIVWCRLFPGEEVSEARLAQLYGFGKAPIRYALSRLIQEGYVTSINRRGHMIAPVTLQSVRDLFDMRYLLEPAAVAGACGRVDRALLNELNAKCARDYRPGDVASEAEFMAANREFHMAIVRRCGNARLIGALEQIMDEMTRLLHLGFVNRARPVSFRAEHEELIDAVVEDRPDDARAMTQEHVQSVRGLVIDGLITHTALSQTNIVPV